MYFLLNLSRALRAAIKPTLFWMTIILCAYFASAHAAVV